MGLMHLVHVLKHFCPVRHQAKMQTFSDQIKFVYRDYANAVNAWKVEKQTMEKRSMPGKWKSNHEKASQCL
eukprot:1140840-Pelagomonas_calceolata.AAC.16